jgi:hypothetical protein
MAKASKKLPVFQPAKGGLSLASVGAVLKYNKKIKSAPKGKTNR